MKTRKLIKPLVIILWSLIVCVIVIELGLQIASFVIAGRSARLDITDPGAPVILCVGDSSTYGQGVRMEESYPYQLQAKIRKMGYRVNVVNRGIPGVNTSVIRYYLPAWLREYRPVAVIILASVNNIWNIRYTTWSDYMDGIPTSLTSRLAAFFERRVKTVHGLTILFHRFGMTPWLGTESDRHGRKVFQHLNEVSTNEEALARWNRAARDLTAIVSQVKKADAVPVLMTYVGFSPTHFVIPNALLRKLAAALDVTLADNDKVVRSALAKDNGTVDEATRDIYFFPDVHLKGPGYDKVSDNVLAVLERAGVIKLLPTSGSLP